MKIGIVGVSGFGGGELLRLCAGHPTFEIAYVAGESTAGKSLAQLFPALGGHPAGRLVVQPFVPEETRGEVAYLGGRARDAARETRRRGLLSARRNLRSADGR